ncbi:cysteine protease ATG4D-like [Dysidea avara]|uniref:cysteine protease ATG4D-like n=1 Tax=Dysidea avara TaxID=196820 RepID=UPI00332FE671
MAKADSSYGPLRTRLASTWYKLKHGWLYSTGFDVGKEPLFLLGKCYSDLALDKPPDTNDSAPTHIKHFVEHFLTITWLTYRKDFPPIEGTQITTDCGWGCMVRSGQMMLATALSYHLLGKEWRLAQSDKKQRMIHRQILTWFEDQPGTPDTCPFALHQLMEVASNYGYSPGNWFGPAQVAVLLRDSVTLSRNHHPLLHNMMVYMAKDCTIYLKDVEDMYKAELSGGSTALLLLVPIRLGSDTLNVIYIPCIKALLAMDHCIGIIGGRPKHSVYFVGFQESKLLYLDPHYVQKRVDMSRPDFDLTSFHSHLPQRLHAVNMDPSCTLGFYCRSQEDFNKFCDETKKVTAPPLQRGHYPFFTFSDNHEVNVVPPSSTILMSSMRGHNDVDSGHYSRNNNEDEEFVVIECPITTSPRPLVTSTAGTSSQHHLTDPPIAATNDGVQTDLETTKSSLNSVPH